MGEKKAFEAERLISVRSHDPERPRSNLGFWAMPSRDVRLLCLTLQLFASRGEDVALWLGVTRQRVNQWSTGREPMPLSRQKQLLEIMERRVEMVRGIIFGDKRITEALDVGFLDADAAKTVITLLDTVMLEEAERLKDVESAAE